MRSDDLSLGFIFAFSVVICLLLGGHLKEAQREIASSRHLVAPAPIAGFQKIAADVHWMLYLNYLGHHEVNEQNLEEIERRIQRIIELDPDFGVIYYEGALMLAPVDKARALALLDQAIDHPRLRHYWRYPFLAALILMRDQRWRFHQEGEMDPLTVVRAQEYLVQALRCPGGSAALSNFVFTEAYLNYHEAREKLGDQARPFAYYELAAWIREWRRRHEGYEGDDDYDEYLEDDEDDEESRYEGGELSSEMVSASGRGFWRRGRSRYDVTQRIIGLLRRIREDVPEISQDDPLIARALRTVYSGGDYDQVDFAPLDPADHELVEHHLPRVQDEAPVLKLASVYAYKVLEITAQCDRGSARVQVTANGRPIPGLDVVAGNHVQTALATARHHLRAGETLRLRITEATPDAAGLSCSLSLYRQGQRQNSRLAQPTEEPSRGRPGGLLPPPDVDGALPEPEF